MPQIGEIVKNEKYQRFIWHACEECGKPRWVLVVRNEARSKLCRICSAKRKQPSIWRGYTKRPRTIGKRAMVMIQKLVNQGIIKREPCSVCGNERSVVHHPDYTKPLEVVWLCQKHHTATHRSTLKIE